MDDKSTKLSYCGALVYEQDRDRFLSAMTAAPSCRERLFALYSFNHEISKTSGVVSEPMLGQIRLQWWREAIEECYAGKPRRHAVVTVLAQAIAEAKPTRMLFERLIDAREADLDFVAPGKLEDLESYARETSGLLTELALEMTTQNPEGLSEEVRGAARDIGTAWAMIGLMRALPFHMRVRKGMLPGDLAGKHGVTASDLAEARNVPGLRLAVRDVCARASELLGAARETGPVQFSKSAVYGALSPGVLADGYLKQLRKVGFDVFDPKLATPPVFRGFSLMTRSIRGRF